MADNRPDPNAVSIASLRWQVVIATREQAMDPDSSGIIETIAATQMVRADIQPIGPMTFYGAAQVDTPVTHKITIRFVDFLDTTCVIFRTTARADGSPKVERYRVRRILPVDGRQRFLRIEAELEQAQ